jgi:hippurate hydrolase
MRFVLRITLVFLLSAVSSTAANGDEMSSWLEENHNAFIDLYRQFHRQPELSHKEVETARRLAAEWRKTGAEVTTGVGGTGVVAIIKNGEGPTVLLRTDLDALPVEEKTGLVFASQITATDPRGLEVPVMHACGHDLHMTNLVGTAKYLAEHKDQWKGTLMLIGQPAEELGEGAKRMLDDGLFKRFPKPDFAVALHGDPSQPTGKVTARAGYLAANVDSIDITIRGRGGHGAWPHLTIDPVVIAAKLILDLQTIASREIKPGDPVVVTVGSIQGGTKHNIIGDQCKLQLTIRSYSTEARKQIHEAIRRKAKAAAQSAGAPEPEIKIPDEYTPAVQNDEQLTSRAVSAMRKALGDENVLVAEPTMGGEDFSQYHLIGGVPICMFRLGVTRPVRMASFARLNQQPPSLHSPLFYPDIDEALPVGIRAMTAVAMELLNK